jgi:alpha-beta hydrolase superfamily lysophospholipase
MSSQHGWFGDPAIWAAVQRPEEASLGVVICNPLGQEGVVAYRGLRLLADELERRGIASVRYDPPGRGDAAPSKDPQAPIDGARRAAEVLRAIGCTQIAFVGLSSAALIASAAAESGDLVVLWSPPASGRVWLRRTRSLATIMIGSDRWFEGVESLIGLDLDPAQASALEAIKLTLPTGSPALVCLRPGESAPAAIATAEVLEVPGTAEFLDTSSVSSVMPAAAIRTIAGWLNNHVTAPAAPLRDAPLLTELHLDSAVERITWIGPHRLFAIECAPVHTTSDTPTVVLHAGASEHRVGAGDYQVELARLLAADGVASLRADRRGTGETGPVSATEPSMFYTQAWLDDQDAVVEAAGVPGERLALAGLCAGSWLAGQETTRNPRLVIGIHPLEYRTDTANPNEFVDEVVMPREVSGPFMLAIQRLYRRWAPTWLRRLRARTSGKADAGPFLSGLSARTWRTVLIFSEVDQEFFRRLGGPESAERLRGIELINVPTLDHPLFARQTRSRVIAEIRREVAEAFPAAAAQ